MISSLALTSFPMTSGSIRRTNPGEQRRRNIALGRLPGKLFGRCTPKSQQLDESNAHPGSDIFSPFDSNLYLPHFWEHFLLLAPRRQVYRHQPYTAIHSNHKWITETQSAKKFTQDSGLLFKLLRINPQDAMQLKEIMENAWRETLAGEC